MDATYDARCFDHMRVLLVSQEMPPETGWGGIGTYVDVLSRALAASGHDVHVLSVVDEQPFSRTRQGQVTVHRFSVPSVNDPTGRLPESWRRILLAVSVARLVGLLDLQPDVIECPEWMAEGLAVGLRRREPLVVRLHSSARQIFPMSRQGQASRGLDGRLAAWLEEVSARRAHVVISTRSNLDEVTRPLRLDERALHAIPYPVELPPLRALNGSAPPRVTFVGRLEPRKAPEVVLYAAPTILAEMPETRFVFVGRDGMAPGSRSTAGWLRAQARHLGVDHAIELTGQLDREGLEAELERATVCAFPSRWESFGNVVAEASAVGRPVVTSAIAPFRELVGDGVTGRLVASEDPEDWAAALSEFLRDRALARRAGQAGAAHVAGISNPQRVAELTLAAYADARQRWRHGRRSGRPWM